MPTVDENELIQRGTRRKLIEKYWKWRGGTLVREYEMVKGSKAEQRQYRWLDAVIIRTKVRQRMSPQDLDTRGLTGDDEIEFIQAKSKPLGMGLMGQTLFSRSLMNEKIREKRWTTKARRWIPVDFCRLVPREMSPFPCD